MEFNRYKFVHLVDNLAKYKEQMAKHEEDNKEENVFYKRINETPEIRNFGLEAEQEILNDFKNGVDIEEKYSTKFHEFFPLPQSFYTAKNTDEEQEA